MPEAQDSEVRSRRLLTLVLLAITVLCYARSLQYGFVFDDRIMVVENTSLHSWQSVPGYFKTHLAALVHPSLPGNYYRPGFLLWLKLNYSLWGLHPGLWHLGVIVLHVVATYLVLAVARRLLRQDWLAFVAAGIFGLHPIHVEAVTWVVGVTETLMGVLVLGSFLAYCRAREGQRWWWPVSLLLFGAAVLVKETSLVLPGIIAVCEWLWQAEKSSEGRWKRIGSVALRTAPFVLVLTLYAVGRWVALGMLTYDVATLRTSTLLFTLPGTVTFYLWKLAWPVGLSAFYDTRYIDIPGFTDFVVPLVILGALAIALWKIVPRNHSIGLAAPWLALPLVPLLNLRVFPAYEFAHDRYLYLASVGFAMLAALALGALRNAWQPMARRQALQALAVAPILLLLGAVTLKQQTYWQSNLDLYRRGVAIAPHNDLANTNLATEMFDRGQQDEAVQRYQEVLKRRPNYWLAHYNLGYVLYTQRKLDDAEKHLRFAIALQPTDADAYLRLGVTKLRQNDLESAVTFVRRAIVLRPETPGYHFTLGIILESKGDLNEAAREYERELQIDPKQGFALMCLDHVRKRLASHKTAAEPRVKALPDIVR